MPGTGSCSACQFNTATLKSLFPDYVTEALCTNKECYHQKFAVHFPPQLSGAILEHTPQALIFNREPVKYMREAVQSLPAASVLLLYQSHADMSFFHQKNPAGMITQLS